jgi:hypothetical protein
MVVNTSTIVTVDLIDEITVTADPILAMTIGIDVIIAATTAATTDATTRAFTFRVNYNSSYLSIFLFELITFSFYFDLEALFLVYTKVSLVLVSIALLNPIVLWSFFA